MYTIPILELKDTHVGSSSSMISEAIAYAGAYDHAVILGCGYCTEIPVGEVRCIFRNTDLVERDGDVLGVLEKNIGQEEEPGHVLSFYHADVTGAIASAGREGLKAIEYCDDANECLDHFAEILNNLRPDFWKPSHGQLYDLIICSVVLTELEKNIRQKLVDVFAEKFSDCTDLLSTYQPWREASWDLARRLETDFIHYLDSIVKPDGIIYLSSTVQVSWLQQAAPDKLVTDGAWLMTRTSSLTDYLGPQHQILAKDKWNWISKEREDHYWGKVYGVQAITYKYKQ